MGCLLALCLVVPGGMPESGLRFRVVDAATGAPVANATAKRIYSSLQPQILVIVPRRFWFSEPAVATDSTGVVSFSEHAWDDHYFFHAPGYEPGGAARGWLGWKACDRPAKLDAGVIVVPLKLASASSSGG